MGMRSAEPAYRFNGAFGMRLSSADRMLYRKERKNCPLGLSTFGFGALQRYGKRGIFRMHRQEQTQGVLVSPVAPLGLFSQCLLGVVQVKMRGVYSITFRASHVLGIRGVFDVRNAGLATGPSISGVKGA